MSETLNHRHETATPSIESSAQELAKETSKIEGLAKESLNNQKENLESARTAIEKQAISNELVNLDQETNEATPTHHYITKHVKEDGYRQTIKHVQSNLSSVETKFSQVIHQPKIEAISEFGAKTIARPSSIISASLVALLMGFVLVIVARHIGFYVSPLAFSVLFVVGYVLGLLIELIVKLVMKLFKHKPHYL